jgi:hypothetical protein
MKYTLLQTYRSEIFVSSFCERYFIMSSLGRQRLFLGRAKLRIGTKDNCKFVNSVHEMDDA